MKHTGRALSLVSRASMELSWRYAWVFFLTFLSMGFLFPLPAAAGILCVSAVLNLASYKRGWQMIQVVLLNLIGFMACALLFLHHFRYPAYPVWSMEWIGRLVGDPSGIVEWFLLLLTVFCLILIWRGGWYLKKSPGDYLSVCLQFDKGLGLLFGLLVVNAVFITRAGVGMPANALGFVMPAYLIFGLCAIGFNRHQHDVQKSFLSGYRGLGIIFSVAAMTILFCSGIIFLFHPYLFPAADALLATLDQTTTPMVPYLVRVIRYLLVPRHTIRLYGDIEEDEAVQIELSPPPDDGWMPVVANILVWVTMGVVILMIAGLIFYVLKRLFAWLLSKDPVDSSPLTFKAWALGLLKSLAAIPLTLWRFLTAFFKQVDSAAMVYVRLLKWGQHSGVLKRRNETPDEYAKRLMRLFPGFHQEIRQIVDAFNREVYGLIQTTPDMLIDIKKAQRRMKSIRHWPQRAKVWLLY